MCLSAVYLQKGEERSLVMDRVAHIRVSAEGIELEDLLGRLTTVPSATLFSVDLLDNVALLRQTEPVA